MSAELFSAIRAGDSGKVTALIDGDPGLLDAKDESGLGPFTVAKYSRQDEIASLLLQRGARLDIFAACMAGVHPRVVELLAADRGLVNSYSHDGWTPLQAVAQSGDVKLVRLLIANGADVKARAENNQSALDLAMTKGHQAVVELLEQHGASQ